MPMPMPLSGEACCPPPPGLESHQMPPNSDARKQWCPPVEADFSLQDDLFGLFRYNHSFDESNVNHDWAQPWKVEIDTVGSTYVRPTSSRLNLENSTSHYFMPQGLVDDVDNRLEPYESQEIVESSATPQSEDEVQDNDDSQDDCKIDSEMSYVNRVHQRRRDRKKRQRQRKQDAKTANSIFILQDEHMGNASQSAPGQTWPLVPPGLFPVKVHWGASDPSICDNVQPTSPCESCQQIVSTKRSPYAVEPEEATDNKWHASALTAGHLYQDGHVFVKTEVGPKKNHPHGTVLSSLCMIFEQKLARGGSHSYRFSIIGGNIGAADGIGFVLDTKIRHNNIQRVRSIFLNKRGQVCIRNLDQITKLPCSLPKLAVGTEIILHVDLDYATAQFKMEDEFQNCTGLANLSFRDLVDDLGIRDDAPVTGFFCAVLTNSLTVSIY